MAKAAPLVQEHTDCNFYSELLKIKRRVWTEFPPGAAHPIAHFWALGAPGAHSCSWVSPAGWQHLNVHNKPGSGTARLASRNALPFLFFLYSIWVSAPHLERENAHHAVPQWTCWGSISIRETLISKWWVPQKSPGGNQYSSNQNKVWIACNK